MLLTLFLATCAVSSAVYAIQTTLFFDWFRQACNRIEARESAWVVTKWIIAGLKCPYCLSHWVSAVVVSLMASTWTDAAMLWLPVVWLTSHALELHRIVHQVIPFSQAWMQTRVESRQ